jgi:hypothetical protein
MSAQSNPILKSKTDNQLFKVFLMSKAKLKML